MIANVQTLKETTFFQRNNGLDLSRPWKNFLSDIIVSCIFKKDKPKQGRRHQDFYQTQEAICISTFDYLFVFVHTLVSEIYNALTCS